MKPIPAVALATLLAAFPIGLFAVGFFSDVEAQAAPDAPHTKNVLDVQGRQFAQIALALSRVDAAAVDANFGPVKAPPGKPPSLGALRAQLRQLSASVHRDPVSPRQTRLQGKVDSLAALAATLNAPPLPFAEEAKRVYGMKLPVPDEKEQAQALRAVDRLLPGKGDVNSRLSNWRDRFEIPAEMRKAVFLRALAECRKRTVAHWKLPPGEKLDVTWNYRAPAAYHHYKGHNQSWLEINPNAVADPGTALDVACHEAYPGHHMQYVEMEARGLNIEDTVVVLHSPEMVLREGAANYGVDLVFPPSERLAFTRDVLFPLAGFPKKDAARYEELHRLTAILSRSVLPILAEFYDGKQASGDAEAHLVIQGLISSPLQLEHFTRANGAYLIGYTAARDLVRDCVEVRARKTGQDKWTVLNAIVSGPDLSVLSGCR